jgi:UDP-N-acetylmuramate--alanine ligase
MVAETDESDRSHLLLPSSLSILTNIDFEHANIYKNIEDVQQTFLTFLQKLPFYGKAILCIDDPNITTLIPQLTSSYLTYGTTNQADIQATHIQLHENSSLCTIIDHRHHITYKPITIPLPSIYNVLNATAAICTALEVGIPFETIAQAIETFQGVDRRFIFKGTIPTLNVDIFDDYGHHPTEIYHSLITARRKTKHKLIVVFQPQRYTRTYHLWDQFIQVFKDADIDHLIITDIYPSSEPAIEHITGKNLAQAIAQNHPQAVVHYIQYDAELKALSTYLTTIISPDDLILLLGAGKVNQLAEILLSKT